MEKEILSGAFFTPDSTRGTFTEHKGKSPTTYSRTAYSFDIETTLIRESEQTFMYVGQLAVNDTCYIFRDWETIMSAFETLYNNAESQEITNIIWIANLGYEMSFMLPRLALHFKGKAQLDVFCDSPRHPIYVRLVNDSGAYCVEFRDTLRVSGMNLRNTAKNYCKTQKLEMDYSDIRNSKTDISDIIDYCANDVFICNEYYDYLLESLVDKGEYLPYTQTGIIRNRVRADYEHSEYAETNAIKSMFPKTLTEYNRVMNWLYSGGITHANHDFVGDVVENVNCIDFTSSYPAVMAHENKFPIGPFTRTKLNTFESLSKSPAWYCTVTFKNITQTTSHSLISVSKCIKSENIIEDNGRVMNANEITIMLNNIDFEYISLFYKWDCYRITSAYICKTVGRLPEYLLKNMLYNGQMKAELKEQGKADTPEYCKNKAMFNGYYGLCVQRLVRDSIMWSFEDGYITSPPEDYNKIKNNAILNCYWGVYVTSFARRNLCINMWNIEQTGAKVVYYDTDSLYVKDIYKAKSVIDQWNTLMYSWNDSLNLHKCFHNLGAWDIDPTVTMKTLGAKRYIKMDSSGKVKCTIAGLPKKSFPWHDKTAFEHFNENMEISAAESMKLTAKYKNTTYSALVTDSYGNSEEMMEYCGVSLIEIPFKLTLSTQFKNLLNKLHKHY